MIVIGWRQISHFTSSFIIDFALSTITKNSALWMWATNVFLTGCSQIDILILSVLAIRVANEVANDKLTHKFKTTCSKFIETSLICIYQKLATRSYNETRVGPHKGIAKTILRIRRWIQNT